MQGVISSVGQTEANSSETPTVNLYNVRISYIDSAGSYGIMSFISQTSISSYQALKNYVKTYGDTITINGTTYKYILVNGIGVRSTASEVYWGNMLCVNGNTMFISNGYKSWFVEFSSSGYSISSSALS